MQEKLSNVTDENGMLWGENIALRDQLEKSERDKSELYAKLKWMNAENDTILDEDADLRAQLSTCEKEKDNLQKTLDEANADNETLRDQLIDLRDQLTKSQEEKGALKKVGLAFTVYKLCVLVMRVIDCLPQLDGGDVSRGVADTGPS